MGSCRLWSVAICVCVAAVAAADERGGRAQFGWESWFEQVVEVGLDPDAVVYPFGTSPEMVAWAQTTTEGRIDLRPIQKLVRLQDAMFEGEAFDFIYNGYETLTAEEAFLTRQGNCISFTALFVALSRSLGVPTRLMSVERTPEVERVDGLVVINRHVVAAYQSGSGVVTFDFNFTSETQLIRREFIDDIQASAMFHNNLGATALRAKDASTARSHLEITTTLWPEWAVGWVNLGVTLYHLGSHDGALKAYNRALEADPASSSALNNMAYIYLELGREAEARTARRAAAKSTDNPFTLVAMADSEMIRGNLDEAARYLKLAKRSYSREPEVFEGLARLNSRTGNDRRAEKYRRKAEKIRAAGASGR